MIFFSLNQLLSSIRPGYCISWKMLYLATSHYLHCGGDYFPHHTLHISFGIAQQGSLKRVLGSDLIEIEDKKIQYELKSRFNCLFSNKYCSHKMHCNRHKVRCLVRELSFPRGILHHMCLLHFFILLY